MVSTETLKIMEMQSIYGINFDSKTFYIAGELTEHLGTDLRMRYNMLKAYHKSLGQEIKEITLDISSPGGTIYSIYGALDFYAELKKDGILVNTITNSICMSAATILVSGATGKRMASKRASFMLHDLQIGGMEGTANQIKNASQQLEEDQLELFSYYVEYSSKEAEGMDEKTKAREAKKWIKKYCKNNEDHYLSSKEILDLGLIDEIV